MQYTADMCAEHSVDGLPCTVAVGAEKCPHYILPAPIPPGSLSAPCLAAANQVCGTVRHTSRCAACIGANGKVLKHAGCPKDKIDMDSLYCGTSGTSSHSLGSGAGVGTTTTGPPHHVCDLSLPSRIKVFGE